jgi:hypothetical protein
MTPSSSCHQRWTAELLRNLHHLDPHENRVRSYSSRGIFAIRFCDC